MLQTFTRGVLALCSLVPLLAATGSAGSAPSAHNLPIFFFHGINGNAANGNLLKANLSSDARPFFALNTCETICTLGDLNDQAAKAMAQVRSVVANDTRFQNGYVFIGHSLGGAVARTVIENMDEHKVHTFISLAGAQNGIVYGAQPSDLIAGQQFLRYYAPVFYQPSVFNYSKYTTEDLQTGKAQADLARILPDHPELQTISGIQLGRSPVEKPWLQYNTFYPVVNNLQSATTDAIKVEQARRKNNFLKLQAAHFFASSYDETISPWQSALFGKYEPVESVEEYQAKFSQMKVLPMTDTPEYQQDTYGLQTLDKRGGLFLHPVDTVPHSSWISDATSPRDGKVYPFMPIYAKNVYPLLALEEGQPPVQTTPAPTTSKPYC